MEFRNRFFVCLALTVPILLLSETIQVWLGIEWLKVPFQNVILFLLSLAIYVYGGWPFLKGMIPELKSRQPGMMMLISMAISVAFFYSAATVFVISGMDFFWELATLIDVMLLGHWVETRSVLGASMALEELVKIMPTTAHLLKNGGEVVDVPVSELKRDDLVLVRPGEKISSDGTVAEGESFVNEALLTGESKPIHKTTESQVIGGSINGEGVLKVRIQRTGEATYLAQVVRLVRQAQESKSRTQDLANRASALLFYVALGTGILTYVIWFLLGRADVGVERSITVLVIACPHALGLAIPLVVALSTSITAKGGILIRDRKAFEMIKDANAVVFDKTGTLTTGKFGVSDMVAFISEDKFLGLTASVEVNSEHIIAKAIVEFAEEKEVTIPQAKDFKAIPGRGAFGKVGKSEVYVGNPGVVAMKIGVKDERITKLQAQGKTVVFTFVDGELAGALALSDTVRRESQEAVKELKDDGVKVFMLTGDSKQVAESVAKELGIDEYFAEVLPDQKADKIKLLKEQGYRVAMVGDGINDAPALVTADVGVAIGSGTDVAIESADIILVKNDPRDVPKVMDLSRKTYSKMVQNLWWAAGYNIFAIPLAAGILYGYGVILNPAVGALLMSLSTVIVALNSQTLRKYEPKGMGFSEEELQIECPVCGMQLEPGTAYSKMEYKGKVVYFCSKQHEEDFTKKPEKYMPQIIRDEEKKEHAH